MPSNTNNGQPFQILMVDDSPGDIRLAQEAFRESKTANEMHAVENGIEAMAYLRNQEKYADAIRPDLILLDLNMPGKDGRQVLEEIKADDDLRQIPIIVLTISNQESDIINAYDLHANCYITKPIDLHRFIEVATAIEDFWLTIAKLPRR
ncbi:MAG: response regulator [Chloroflexi bacterium]|jgi:two-component system, chemotaxis family, response regulator Rcp1|nr:response regulator [Chloroflexota bacterium]